MVISLVHELGHYLFLRLFQVPVKEFSIGIGPRIIWYEKNNTIWSWRLLLFMAYVDFDVNIGYKYLRKWKKLLILSGGVINNIILGVVLIIPIILNPSLLNKLILSMSVAQGSEVIMNFFIIVSHVFTNGGILLLLTFTGVFSLLAAIINFLPIPGLDGGWVLLTSLGLPENKIEPISTMFIKLINVLTFALIALDLFFLIVRKP